MWFVKVTHFNFSQQSKIDNERLSKKFIIISTSDHVSPDQYLSQTSAGYWLVLLRYRYRIRAFGSRADPPRFLSFLQNFIWCVLISLWPHWQRMLYDKLPLRSDLIRAVIEWSLFTKFWPHQPWFFWNVPFSIFRGLDEKYPLFNCFWILEHQILDLRMSTFF